MGRRSLPAWRTDRLGRANGWRISPHRRKVAVPKSLAEHFEYPPSAGESPPYEVGQGAIHRPRARAFSRKPRGLFEEPFVDHKGDALHAHTVTGQRGAKRGIQPAWFGGVEVCRGNRRSPFTDREEVWGGRSTT